MNEFLEQFLLESRDLVQQATEDLLALEASPRQKDRIDSVFRGFHTLKGAAGIVDFPAMGQLMHGAEDALSAVRSGTSAVSPELIGDCLACLDQVVRWLDTIETSGDLPAASSNDADALARKFVAVPDHAASPEPPAWLEPFVSRHPRPLHRACVALRYQPASDCFFRGEDPFDLVCRLPDILALEVSSERPWPPLDALDPFTCAVVFTVLAAETPETVAELLGPVAGQLEIHPLPPHNQDLSAEARAVLHEQLLLISDGGTAGFSGRLGSAGRVAINVARRAGRAADVRLLEDALEQSWRQGTAAALIGAIGALLDEGSNTSPDDDAGTDAPVDPVDDQLLELPIDVADEPDNPAVEGSRAPGQNSVVQTLRIGVERIDALMRITGELMVAKNAIGHVVRLAQEQGDLEVVARMLKERHALLDRLVGDLRRSVLEIRVLPLRHVFQRFPRLVREMARDLGKAVRLTTEGEATEADKATVETLFEPMLHVLRNALDHGIEPAAERRAAGKPEMAELHLRAVRDGDIVIVEVTDDGRGIDTGRVRSIAARVGIASPEALAEMNDTEVAELIFAPGFSTASVVTDVSGRGVGMDVVRSTVGRLGGRVTVSSLAGRGTTVRFTLPFTVMLIKVMTVEVSGQVFGIPIDNVIETTRLPRDRVSLIGVAEALVLRGRTVPLIRLAETLDLPRGDLPRDDPSSSNLTGPAARPEARIVIVALDGESGAIEVDEFGERMDVMLRPMEGLLAGIGGFAGTTVLGDGRVLIVLGLHHLLRSQEPRR